MRKIEKELKQGPLKLSLIRPIGKDTHRDKHILDNALDVLRIIGRY